MLIWFSNVFLLILLAFSSTFSAAEESIVPRASPGHIKKKYEVSSQASPFYSYRIFSSGMFGKQNVWNNLSLHILHRGKLPELKLQVIKSQKHYQ